MNAFPFLLGAMCVMAIMYRYYSAFIAAKVIALNDSRTTPAHAFNDGSNYIPTNKWVLFGHHFAAISGGRAAYRSGSGSAIRISAGILVATDRSRARRRRA